jgi:hypothetical protein
MTDGLVVFMRSDVSSSGHPLSVQEWVELAKDLS